MKKYPFGLKEEDMKRLHRDGIEYLISVGEALLKRAALSSYEKNKQIQEIEELKKLREICIAREEASA